MYCFTCVNNPVCVLAELSLWSEISSEHPVFVKTVADLTKKNLPQSTVNRLMEVRGMFTEFRQRIDALKTKMSSTPYVYPEYFIQLRQLVDEFLIHDGHALAAYAEVKEFGKEDKIWQTLLQHIIHEQTFMYELFNDIKIQLNR